MVVSFMKGQVNNLIELVSNKFHYGNNFAGHVVQLFFGKQLLKLIIHFKIVNYGKNFIYPKRISQCDSIIVI